MKFPVVDYSWCQSSVGHGMYEISSSGLFIKEPVSEVACLVIIETFSNKRQLLMSSFFYFSIMFYD